MGRVDLHAGESAVGRSTRETVVGVLAGLRYLLARFGMEEWRAAVDRREFVYLGVCEQLHSVLLVLTRCHERQGGVLLADGYAHATRWRPQQCGSHVVVCDGLAVIAAPRTTRGIHPAHLPRAVLLRRTAYRYGMLPNPPLADRDDRSDQPARHGVVAGRGWLRGALPGLFLGLDSPPVRSGIHVTLPGGQRGAGHGGPKQ